MIIKETKAITRYLAVFVEKSSCWADVTQKQEKPMNVGKGYSDYPAEKTKYRSGRRSFEIADAKFKQDVRLKSHGYKNRGIG